MNWSDILGFLILCALFILVCWTGQGYSNTIDRIALTLHRHAIETRRRHARHTAKVSELWVLQLERDGQPDSPNPAMGLTNITDVADITAESMSLVPSDGYRQSIR